MKTLPLRSLATAATIAILAVTDATAAQTAPAPTQEPAAQTTPAAPQEPAAQAAPAPAGTQEPGAQASAPRRERTRAPRVRRDLITREEIAASGATNLYEVVQRLRPAWMRGTSASNLRGGGTSVVVYQGNTPLGGLEALRQLTTGYAASLRYLEGTEASNTLPGLGSRRVAGAIVVVLPGTGGR